MEVPMDCPKCSCSLVDTYTPRGVVVDYCPACQGIWFDKGELNYFSKSPMAFSKLLQAGLKNPVASSCLCPRCKVSMNEGGFIKDELLIEQCPSCCGVWLDAQELTAMQLAEHEMRGLDASKLFSRSYKASSALEEITGEKIQGSSGGSFSKAKIPLPKLPNLLIRSLGTLVVLYAMLGVIMIVLAEADVLTAGAAVFTMIAMIILNFLISPFFLDIFMSWFQSLTFVEPGGLPHSLRNFVDEICRKENMAFPRFGIIDDGTPNAFTYGHYPGNARIVITRGLMEKLDSEELNAVVAHEIGHAVHWDILVMTAASVVPILLYYISKTLMKMKSRGRNGKNPFPMIGIIAYIMYVAAEYAVLFLSRTREYWADRYSADATRNPNALASALIKIAYGLSAESSKEAEYAAYEGEAREPRHKALGALGIFDSTSAKALVATSVRNIDSGSLSPDNEEISKENISAAMQWDLWNPWALYYELHSTHPLPARRIDALAKHALSFDQTPYIVFNRTRPESYWDDFFVDFAVQYMPLFALAGASIAAGTGYVHFGLAPALLGAAYLLQVLYSYPAADFPDHSVVSLLKYIKVSAVRPVPATIRGRIIGKGVPGLIYSEDLVMQDNTGYIFLNYEQPLNIFNFLFGIKNTAYIGTEVVVTGWYRRAPVPYFEIYKMQAYDGVNNCYIYWYKIIFAIFLTGLGIFLMAGI